LFGALFGYSLWLSGDWKG